MQGTFTFQRDVINVQTHVSFALVPLDVLKELFHDPEMAVSRGKVQWGLTVLGKKCDGLSVSYLSNSCK